MADEDREILVDTRYPLPPYVDGMEYVAPDDLGEEEDWTDAEDESPLLTVDEIEQSNEIVQTPTPLSVTEQTVVYPKGGGAVVNAVLLIDEVPYVTDYEIRVVPR